MLFTAGRPGAGTAPVEGVEPGTFALELIHLAHRRARPGHRRHLPLELGARPVRRAGHRLYRDRTVDRTADRHAGNHGGMSPWTVRNTFIAWGVDFKRGATIRTPVSNVDITPTLLALIGFDRDATLPRFDGRAIVEAFVDGPDEEQIPMQTITHVSRRRTAAIALPSRSAKWARNVTSTRAGG